MKDNLLQLAYKFINDEIDQSTYINRHDKNWYEVKILAETDSEKLGELLVKLSLVYRRRALLKVSNLSREELRALLLGEDSESDSTISDLFNPSKSSRKFDYGTLAKLSIILGVPFNWVRQEKVNNRMNYVSYELLENVISLDEISERQKFAEGMYRVIDGYIIELPHNQSLYVRLERRSNVIVLGLYNSNSSNVKDLIPVLKSSSLTWYGLCCRSIAGNHEYFTWIGAKDEQDILRVINEEFSYVKSTFRLC